LLTIYHYLRDFPAEADHLNGGMEKAVAGLAAGLAQVAQTHAQPVQSVILCEGPRDADVVRDGNVRVRAFDNRATQHKRFGIAPSLKRFVADELHAQRSDSLVVLHAIFHPSVHLLSRMFRRLNIPYVAAPHDPYHPSIFSANRTLKLFYWYLMERPMLRGARAVQVLDERHGVYLRQLGIDTPIIEVVNGFSPAEVPEASSLRWRDNGAAAAAGDTSILFLGRIDAVNKGLDLLVDAFAQVAAEFRGAKLTIQGPDRGDRADLQEQIQRLGLSQRVHVLDADYTTRPGDLAARHDISVLPSRFEGFGLSALEAMLAARPVVISDIAGLAPHVKRCDCGTVVEPKTESIAAGLRQVLARRHEWKPMGLRGRQYVLENLNWKHIAADALRDYRSLLDRPLVPTGATIAA
jgi:glycosyltransferase involved in cell wall biosynthesis